MTFAGKVCLLRGETKDPVKSLMLHYKLVPIIIIITVITIIIVTITIMNITITSTNTIAFLSSCHCHCNFLLDELLDKLTGYFSQSTY